MSATSNKVGSKIVFENDKVIVWDFQLQPGEETPMHRHDHSYIWYAIQGGALGTEDADGNDLGVFDVPTGAVFNIKHDGERLEVVNEGSPGMLFPTVHKAKNLSDTPYREILIEFK